MVEVLEDKIYWYKYAIDDRILHREDGPALEFDGYKAWYINGMLHREDGPARMWDNGHEEWALNGKVISKEEHEALSAQCKDKIIEVDGIRYKLVKA